MGDSDQVSRPVQQIPRREHPRPDFHRGTREGRDWLNLNGTWEFEFDPNDVGENEGWAQGQRPFSDRLIVPFPWESRAAWDRESLAGNEDWFDPKAFLDPDSVTKENYRDALRHEIGWYRRQFQVPSRWAGERVFLRFGAVDWEAKVWVDGQEAGRFESGYLPAEMDITELLQGAPEATHVLVVRVYDPNDHGEQPCGKQYRWYARTSGIWQTVWLEPRGHVFLQRVRFLPKVADGRVTCELAISNRSGGTEAQQALDLGVRITVDLPEGGATIHTAAAGEALEQGLYCTDIALDGPRLWSPDDPVLYPCTIELLEEDGVVDLVHTYFGLREVRTGPLPGREYRYVWLNGQPVYLRGVLDQAFHPAGIYTFPSDEAIAQDIRAAKEAGFNFIRMHIKADDPRFFYWADRLGMLVMADMPNFGYGGAWGPRARKRWERTMRRTIERDFNHPCILAWCLFNETWGLGGEEFRSSPERQQWVEAMYGAAKVLDPTRLVEDNSPCLCDHVHTDLNSWHFYINDYEQAREHIENVVRQTHSGSAFNFVPGQRAGSEPLLNSEYGGISANMGDRDISWCFKFLTNELRRHERICGYVYTELTDVEWERNGLLNYDRTPKELGYKPSWIHSPDFLCLDCPPAQTVACGAKVQVPVLVSHFGRSLGDWVTLRWRLEHTDRLGHEQGIVAQGKRRVAFPRYALTPVGSIGVEAPSEPGLAVLHAWLEDRDGKSLARNFVHFEVGTERSVRRQQVELAARQAATVLRAAPGDLAGGRSEADGELLVASPGTRVEHTWAGSGLEDLIRGRLAAIHIVAELSSHRAQHPESPPAACKQTDGEKWPSRVGVRFNDALVAEQALADHPADARGVLSHYRGLGGQYGELMRLELDPRLVAELAASNLSELRLVLETPTSGGGLTVYGERAGRYPVDVCLVLLHN